MTVTESMNTENKMTMRGWSSSLLKMDGISHRFWGRIGGTSPKPWDSLNISYSVGDVPARVTENLARVRFQLGIQKTAMFTVTQVHSNRVVCLDQNTYTFDPAFDPAELVIEGSEKHEKHEKHEGETTNRKVMLDHEKIAAEQADAIVTDIPNIAVGVRTADCTPILLCDDQARVVAAIHAGWRGAVGGIVAATIKTIAEKFSISPSSLRAAVGPCIGMQAFEVGPEVIQAVESMPDAAKILAMQPQNQPLWYAGEGDRAFLDLAGLCVLLLKNAGIERVDHVAACTVKNREQFFSHRADAGKSGRQMSAISLGQAPIIDDATFA